MTYNVIRPTLFFLVVNQSKDYKLSEVEKTMLEEYRINKKVYKLDLFDGLDKDSAYLVGYLAGDGIYHKPTHKRNVTLGVSSSDRYIVYAMRDRFCPDTEVHEFIPYNKTGKIVSTAPIASMTFSSKFSPVFNKYKVLGLKKDRRIVNVSKKLMRYYLLGLFDADGHVSFGRRKDRNRLWANMGLTHSSYHLLCSVQNFLESEVGISSSVQIRSDGRCFDLKIAKTEAVKRIFSWVYQDLPFTYNKRKFEKVRELLSM